MVASTRLNALRELEEDTFLAVIGSIYTKNTNPVLIQALLDTGASGYAFIDFDFAQKNCIPMSLLSHPRTLEAFDGSSPSFGSITHIVRLNMSIGNHVENDMGLFVTRLSHHPIILGHPWLKKHNPTVDWASSTVIFDSKYCRRFCSPWGVVSAPTISPTTVSVSKVSFPSSFLPVQMKSRQETAVHGGLDNAAVESSRVSESTTSYESLPSSTSPSSTGSTMRLDIARIGAHPFHMLSKKPGHEIFTISLRDLDQTLTPPAPIKIKVDKDVNPATILPVEYHEFLDVFSRKESEVLPPHRPYDHKIELKPGCEPPCGPLYGMSREENLELRKYLEENLEKGFIRASKSPAASPVLFVKKPGGGLRFCVDYRGLNEITIKNRYPLPLISETLNRLSKAVIFSKLDIIAAFNRLRMAKGEEWKTAFRTRYGLFESLVLPFGLCNGPASFQAYINDTLREYLDIFCTAYLDDILIYSDSLEEHQGHVRIILDRLRQAGLQVDITKCEFHTKQVAYLGLIITDKGVRMDPSKIETIVNWPIPRNVKDVQSFLGFANFYRRFIENYSVMTQNLTRLTKKNVVWSWDALAQMAFDELRKAFTSDVVLAHYDPDRKIVVETDASDYVSAGILSQYDDNNVLRPIAFFSKKHAPAECNYEIYDKELMAIVRAFEQWRPELEGSALPIDVITDHKNLEYFMTTKQLSRRQARWSEFLSRFDFKILYRPGKYGEKPDALTRRSADLPLKGEVEDERIMYQSQVVLKPHNLTPGVHPKESQKLATALVANTLLSESKGATGGRSIQNVSKLRLSPITLEHDATETDPHDPNEVSLEQLWLQAKEHDTFEDEVLDLLKRGVRVSKKIPLAECEEKSGTLYFRERQYVPTYEPLRIRLLEECHLRIAAGHPGRGKTYALLSRHYWWPRMFDWVKRFVRNCHTCRRNKASRQTYQGWLRPLAPPEQRWQDISVDYVGPLQISEYQGVKYRYIMVVVDRLSKMRHIEPTRTMETEEACEIYYNRIWRYHGLFRSCVSDRGSQFVNHLWKRMCARLGINAKLSTAYHPETDGQTEKANGDMEQYLRSYVNYLQDDWAKWLAGAEFAANNADSVTTGCSLFLANYGQHPRMGFEPAGQLNHGLGQSERRQILQADAFVDRMQELNEYLHDAILIAQAEQEYHANNSRLPAPRYKIGDQVFLSAKNLRRARPTEKLDSKNVGPFEIERVLSSTVYKLKLPEEMQVHPVFHTNLLQPAPEDPFPGQYVEPRPPVVAEDGELEWYVDRILDSRQRKRQELQYLVLWETGEQTWTSWWNLSGSQDLVRLFHERYPTKPGPHPDSGLRSARPLRGR